MIRQLTEGDRIKTLAFLSKNPGLNLFQIGDIENFGFVMDLKCFFKTIFLVFTKYGVIEGSENLGDKEDKSVDRVSIK